MAGPSSSSSPSSAAAKTASPPRSNCSNTMAMPPPTKTTSTMSLALSHLRSTLTCPLCTHPYVAPHTLPSCGHTFCLQCISDYACNSWECPYAGCCVPITIGKDCGSREVDGGRRGQVGGGGVSGRGGGFVRANPILEGCVESLGRVLRELNEAEEGWWRDAAEVRREKRKGRKGGGGKKKNSSEGGGKKRGGEKKGGKKGKKKMLELSDVYYPEGGGYSVDDIYGDYDEDDDHDDARRSAVTFDMGHGRADFNPPSDDDDDMEKEKKQEEEALEEEEAMTATPNDYTNADASQASGASASTNTNASVGVSASQSTAGTAMDRTVRPDERASLLGGLGLSAMSGDVHDDDDDEEEAAATRNSSLAAATGIGAGAGRRLDATVLLGQKDSLLGSNNNNNNNNNNNSSDVDDFCTAASKQEEEEEDQMTDGTATTNNTNRYFTGQEDDEEEEDGHGGQNGDNSDDDDDSEATDIDEDALGQEDSEATVAHSMPSPSTERKSNIGRGRNSSSTNLHRLSRVDTMDSAAAGGGDLSTLEEGSCETSLNTTGTSSVGRRDKSRGSSVNVPAGTAAGGDDSTIQEPSQCQSLVGHVRNMERRLDSALADAMRSPSPGRADTSGRSGLDQSCAIPRGDDVGVDDDDGGPVFGSQGLSPIMLAGSQMDPTFDYEEEEEEEEEEVEVGDEDRDGKLEAKSTHNNSEHIESKPTSPPSSDGKKRKATSPSNTTHSLRKSTRASSTECKPRVFFLSHSSSLSAAHVRTVRKCIKSNKLSPIGDDSDHTSGSDNSDLDIPYDFEDPDGIASFMSNLKATKDAGGTIYGISTNSEYQYTDGYIVPRSFRYLLGVAAGLPMVDINFLTNNANGNGRGPMGRYLLPAGAVTSESNDETDAGARSKRARRGPSDDVDPFRDPQSGCPYGVCGDTDAKEIGAPQRSLASKQGIFDGYGILLFGDFDHIASATSKSGGRKRRGAASSAAAKVDDSSLYSQGRISLLLQLGGAAVAGLKEVVEASEEKASCSPSTTASSSSILKVMDILQSSSSRRTNDNIVVLVKCKATAKDYKQANKYLKDKGDSLGLVDSSKVPVVSAEWVLDSLSDFSIRKCEEYSK